MRVFVVDDRPEAAAASVRLVQAGLPGVPVVVVAARRDARHVAADARRAVICVARQMMTQVDSAMLGALAGERPGAALFVFGAPEELWSCAALFGHAAAPARLTGREAEVYALLAQGLTNRLIAGRLGLSLPTVKTHLAHIFRKLGAQSRFEAVSRSQAVAA
jgi:DNA-binding CsgD family transcriptional regulator